MRWRRRDRGKDYITKDLVSLGRDGAWYFAAQLQNQAIGGSPGSRDQKEREGKRTGDALTLTQTHAHAQSWATVDSLEGVWTEN